MRKGFFLKDFPILFNSRQIQNQCIQYDQASDNWIETMSMAQNRVKYGLVQLTDTAFWITGKHILTLPGSMFVLWSYTY